MSIPGVPRSGADLGGAARAVSVVAIDAVFPAIGGIGIFVSVTLVVFASMIGRSVGAGVAVGLALAATVGATVGAVVATATDAAGDGDAAVWPPQAEASRPNRASRSEVRFSTEY